MLESPVLILGMFDGVHLGHRAIIESAVALGGSVAAYTFGSHPLSVVKGFQPPMLMTNSEKRDKLLELGVDEVFIERFDQNLSRMPENDYIEMLCNRFKPKAIAAGYNHTFGFGGKGNPDTIIGLSAKFGFKAHIVSPVLFGGLPVSSTRIRDHIMNGDVKAAAELLAQPYSIEGRIGHCMGVGRKMGFPTANIPLPDKLIPPHGVYAARVGVGGASMTGVTNIGVKPTVKHDGEVTIETHILDFSGDIYGQEIRIEFIARLRGEMRFDSKRALAAQIARDREAAIEEMAKQHL